MEYLQLGDIEIEIIKKDIKNVHLSVYPPEGRVRVSSPMHVSTDNLRVYCISRLGWIKKHQKRYKSQNREAPRLFINRESHYFLGKRYMLKIVPTTGKHYIELKPRQILMYVRPNTTEQNRRALMEEWYRTQLEAILEPLLKKWTKILKVEPSFTGIKKMTTKWGSCNEKTKRIWFNLELAKKNKDQIEYVVLHELAHLIERKHNDRFVAVLDKWMVSWKEAKQGLNGL